MMAVDVVGIDEFEDKVSVLMPNQEEYRHFDPLFNSQVSHP